MVKVKYCGICGSDIHNFSQKMYQVPLIMGHEITGVIEKIGENVSNFSLGEKVTCINVKLDLNERDLAGLGIFQDGGFAEFVKVPKNCVFPLPGNISLKDAVMVESFANITRAMKLSQVKSGEKLMIIGGGNIGLCFLDALLGVKNPEYIIVIEPYEFLRNKAKSFGATDAFKPSKSKIKRFTKRNGAPKFIFDCVGIQDTILLSIDMIERGGTLLIEGIHKGRVEIPSFMINSKEIGIKGSLGHDEVDIMDSIDLLQKGIVHPQNFISDTVQLNELQEVFIEHLTTEKRDFIKRVVEI